MKKLEFTYEVRELPARERFAAFAAAEGRVELCALGAYEFAYQYFRISKKQAKKIKRFTLYVEPHKKGLLKKRATPESTCLENRMILQSFYSWLPDGHFDMWIEYER